jgi:excisionase family DNA binding protein
MNEEYYTPVEVAERLKVKPPTIYKWMREGRLKFVYVGADRRITGSAIAEFVRASTEAAQGDEVSSTILDELQSPSFVTLST